MFKSTDKNKKVFLTILFSLLLAFSPLNAKKTLAWDAIPAAYVKQALEVIQKKIDGIILGMLKQQALRTLTQQIEKLVSGKGGNVMFIVDWEDYLIKQPEKNSKKYMNDYLSKTVSGKGSSKYTSSSSKEGFGGNYPQQLVEMGKKATVDKPETPKVTYQGDPMQMFSEGTFKNMSLFVTGINPPTVYVANAEAEYEKKKKEQEKISSTKATSYSGFKGVGEKKDGTGKIKTPGSLIKDKTANTQDLGNKIIAAATHPEEVLTAIVSQLMNQALQQGIGQVQNLINKEKSINDKTTQNSQNQNSQFGPGATYGNPSDSGNCSGKKDGDECTLTHPYNGSTSGKCSGGLCWPTQ